MKSTVLLAIFATTQCIVAPATGVDDDVLEAAQKVATEHQIQNIAIRGVGSIELAPGHPRGYAIDPFRIRAGKELSVSREGRWAVLGVDEIVDMTSIYRAAAAAADQEPFIRIELAINPNGHLLRECVRALLLASGSRYDGVKPLKRIYITTHDPMEPHHMLEKVEIHIPEVPLEFPDEDLSNKPTHPTARAIEFHRVRG